MRQTFFLPYQFPSLNDYVNEERRNRFLGAKMKKEWTDLVTQHVKNIKVMSTDNPVIASFTWFEPNARRDPDNVIFAKKFILDGLVNAGIIQGDSQKWVRGFNAERWIVVKDKNLVGVEVTLQEAARGGA